MAVATSVGGTRARWQGWAATGAGEGAMGGRIWIEVASEEEVVDGGGGAQHGGDRRERADDDGDARQPAGEGRGGAILERARRESECEN